jgi:hypothetical protein
MSFIWLTVLQVQGYGADIHLAVEKADGITVARGKDLMVGQEVRAGCGQACSFATPSMITTSGVPGEFLNPFEVKTLLTCDYALPLKGPTTSTLSL